MKSLLFLLLSIVSLATIAQNEATSFYFGAPQPEQLTNVLQFDSTICGRYVLEDDSLIQLIITPDSITMQQSVLFILTKKDIRKSKGLYYKEGNLLYGIVADKGIPFVMENDTTYALHKQSTNYYSPNNGNILKKQNKNYFLNEKLENNYYSSSLLFSFGKGIAIYSIDHEEVLDEIHQFKQLDSLYLNDFKTYIAQPTLPEMNTFIQKKGFRDGVIFFKPEFYIGKD